MNDEQIRRFFDTQLAAPAQAIQRDGRRIPVDRLITWAVTLGLPLAAAIAAAAIYAQQLFALEGGLMWLAVAMCGLVAAAALYVGVRFLVPPALSADTRLRTRFIAELARPAVEQLRPAWTYDVHASLTPDELFASRLFQRIPLTRFTAGSRIRGRVHDLPFEMHEVIATGEGSNRFMRILLTGFLAHIKLPAPVPGHLRFCRQIIDKAWRRPDMNGYRSLDELASPLKGQYHVDATPDAAVLASVPGLVRAMDDLAKQGWLVHVALGGLSAWVAIERSRAWFEPRVLPPYSADDLLELEYAFAAIEQVAAQLHATVPAATR